MHWLPLVAMVIASVLPFPYSPVTRTVAAKTETGGSGQVPPPPPLPAPTHNCSDGNASQDPCGPNPAPGQPPAGARDRQTTLLERSTPEELRTGRDSQDTDRSDRDAPDVSARGQKGRTSRFSCEDVTQDYSRGDAEDSSQKENPRDSLDRGIVGNDNSPSPLPVPDPGNVSPATHQQRGQGPFSQWEETRVTAETGAASPVGEGEGRSPGTDGGPEGPRGAAESKGRPGPGAEDDLEMGMMAMDGIQEVDELFLDAHPRVLFSPSASPPRHPPLLLMLESGAIPVGEGHAAGGGGGGRETDDPPDAEGHGEGAAGRGPSWATAPGPNRRIKRSDLSDVGRGERSVCESESGWVTDKKTAIDNHGRTVTILPVIQTPTGALKQYFYETRCRRAEPPRGPPPRGSSGGPVGVGLGVAGGGCLGVDKKQWKSECKAKHSFVRALAKDANNRMGWRWIRIDSSCVCVLLARVNRQAAGKV